MSLKIKHAPFFLFLAKYSILFLYIPLSQSGKQVAVYILAACTLYSSQILIQNIIT
jgi:hypothetical protein